MSKKIIGGGIGVGGCPSRGVCLGAPRIYPTSQSASLSTERQDKEYADPEGVTGK